MENITLVGLTLDGVSVVKSLEDENGLNLTEVANAVVSFIRAMGYDYVEGVTFECGEGLFGPVEHGSES